MAKPTLSKRQAWRIAKIQQEKAARAAKKQQKVQTQLPHDLGPEQQGVVVAHYGVQVAVAMLDHALPAHALRRCYLRRNLGSVVTGDRVVWCDADPYGVVVAVQPRQSALSRPDPYGELKTIAANIDVMLIVIAPVPKPHTQLIDRYLVATETMGITPVLVINKADLITAEEQPLLTTVAGIYTSLGYQVLYTSHDGSDKHETDWSTLLAARTAILVGQSGVGKSSLINRLIPDLSLQVGALSEANQKGTHTTTTAQLFHFSAGGCLIDSPGIRAFGLWHMNVQQLLAGFVELRTLASQCQFRDCQHKQEPGCAIQQAYRQGQINPYRMASFEALRRESEDQGPFSHR